MERRSQLDKQGNIPVFTHWMSAVSLRDDIGGECADGVDGNVVGR